MINQTNLRQALHFYRNNQEVWAELKEDFPDILADLTSFEDNPNCTCAGRVHDFFMKKLSEDPNVLNKYNKDPDALNQIIASQVTEQQQNVLAGKIIEVEKGEQAWNDFVFSFLMNKQFHSFSVVERENNVAVYFI